MKRIYLALLAVSVALPLSIAPKGFAVASEEVTDIEGSYEIFTEYSLSEEDIENLTEEELLDYTEEQEDNFWSDVDVNTEDEWIELTEELEQDLLAELDQEEDEDVIRPFVLISKPKDIWEAAAITVVKNKYNHPTTASFIINSVNKANNLTLGSDSPLSKKVVASTAWKNMIKKEIDKKKNSGGFGVGGSVTLPSGETHTALNKVDYFINATKGKNGKWTYSATINDTWDFTYNRYKNNYKSFPVTLANNAAYASQMTGVMKPFKIKMSLKGTN
ncbi:hypothetical protein [Alkalicoccobacillus plakortidis]|uniref:Toxin ETX/toxin MTX2 n=1 Tax=Alkalicoccobacillus plakortidis TaxID=444060 RepID=A0ABT0XDY3_9BACI|nr:hypothetical protein [Alkalicoccobacillus plakortidis]MCM2674111.1 hypothetical protein [Alkalicoccobacillus plakortidis]